jgi:hypothetical protein
MLRNKIENRKLRTPVIIGTVMSKERIFRYLKAIYDAYML